MLHQIANNGLADRWSTCSVRAGEAPMAMDILAGQHTVRAERPGSGLNPRIRGCKRKPDFFPTTTCSMTSRDQRTFAREGRRQTTKPADGCRRGEFHRRASVAATGGRPRTRSGRRSRQSARQRRRRTRGIDAVGPNASNIGAGAWLYSYSAMAWPLKLLVTRSLRLREATPTAWSLNMLRVFAFTNL